MCCSAFKVHRASSCAECHQTLTQSLDKQQSSVTALITPLPALPSQAISTLEPVISEMLYLSVKLSELSEHLSAAHQG